VSEKPEPDMEAIRKMLKEHNKEHPEVLSRPPTTPQKREK
jgi:hypothetical protein